MVKSKSGDISPKRLSEIGKLIVISGEIISDI
jgi:hypothetical protein